MAAAGGESGSPKQKGEEEEVLDRIEGGPRWGWHSETCSVLVGYRTWIAVGDGKDRRKEEVEPLMGFDPGERRSLDLRRRMGGGRSEVGAEAVAYASLFGLGQIKCS